MSPKTKARRSRTEPAAQERREEVLDAALELVSDHGVTGASLRKLAAKLGISQPSLYHYFDSKDAMLEEILEHCGNQMLLSVQAAEMPQAADDLPRFVRDVVIELWSGARQPRFVRFLFVMAIERPESRKRIQQLFDEKLYPGFSFLVQAFARDPEEGEELERIVKMIVYSLGLALLEERALFDAKRPSQEVLRQGSWLVEAGQRLWTDFQRQRETR